VRTLSFYFISVLSKSGSGSKMSSGSGSSQEKSESTTPDFSFITIFFVVAEAADEQADLGPVYWQP
jgi:hypothetical protein